MAKAVDGLDMVEAEDRTAWRAWLVRHHGSARGAWLACSKVRARTPGVTYVEALEEALCFGWIDSRMNPLDQERYLQRFTPRRPTSVWSPPNKRRVKELTAAGLMTEAGLRAIDVAKRNGSWNALDASDALRLPAELRVALDASPRARKHFEAFSPSARKQVIYWIESAKRPETRARRIAETVLLAARNRRPGQERARE